MSENIDTRYRPEKNENPYRKLLLRFSLSLALGIFTQVVKIELANGDPVAIRDYNKNVSASGEAWEDKDYIYINTVLHVVLERAQCLRNFGMLTVHNINIPDSSVTMRIKNGANNPCLVKTKISNILTETDVVINGKVQEGARFEPTKELDARNFEIYTSRILSKNPNYELVAGGLSLRSILNNKPITSFIEMMEEIQLHYSGAWIKKTFYIVDKRNNNVIEPIIRLELQVSERSFYKYRQVYIKNISGMTVILTKNEDYTPASQHRFLDGNYNPVTFVRKRYEITESQVPDYVNKKYIVVLDPKTKIYYVLTQEWIEKSNSY